MADFSIYGLTLPRAFRNVKAALFTRGAAMPELAKRKSGFDPKPEGHDPGPEEQIVARVLANIENHRPFVVGLQNRELRPWKVASLVQARLPTDTVIGGEPVNLRESTVCVHSLEGLRDAYCTEGVRIVLIENGLELLERFLGWFLEDRNFCRVLVVFLVSGRNVEYLLNKRYPPHILESYGCLFDPVLYI
ncbi:MAG TPA: hypothetical protein VFQ60_01000 [Patescibacteria group bacterium]|nr:hypothetical protein [Patescibacteria group bacterium]